ncbi:MAG: cation:proton antiporter [Thermoguttaceae bacterium]
MPSLITDLIYILLGGLLGGMVAKALKQPLIIGYILVGVMLGPNTPGIRVSSEDTISTLAEVGVALLLFSLGIEFSLRELKPLGKIATYGVAVQVILTTFFGYLIGQILDWPPLACFCLGISIVSASTAVILKSLVTTGHVGTLSGRVMLGLSISQDLMMIPLVIIMTSLHHSDGGSVWGTIYPIMRAALFVGIMLIVGSRVIPILLRVVAHGQSQELFLFSVIGISLGIGYISSLFGLSLAFGAFVAGLVLSGSDYGNKALSDMIPLRDVFALVFFVSVGTLLQPAFIESNLLTIIALVTVVCFGRGLILGGLCWSFGYRNVIPLAAFLGMMPISEIGFIVISQAHSPVVSSILCTTCHVGGPLQCGKDMKWVQNQGDSASDDLTGDGSAPKIQFDETISINVQTESQLNSEVAEQNNPQTDSDGAILEKPKHCSHSAFFVMPIDSKGSQERQISCKHCAKVCFIETWIPKTKTTVQCQHCQSILPDVRVPTKGAILSDDSYSLILNLIVISMLIGPMISLLTAPIYRSIGRVFRKSVRPVALRDHQTTEHVVIAGGQNIGHYVAGVLRFLKLPYIVIEPNHRIFEKLQEQRIAVLFGDPTQQTMLQAANLQKSRLLIITSDDYETIITTSRAARAIKEDIRIVVQCEMRHGKYLRDNNLYEVIHPEHEVGIEMLRQILHGQHLATKDAERYLNRVRQLVYSAHENSTQEDRRLLRRLRRSMGLLDLEWIMIMKGSPLIGKTATDIERDITVVGIMRKGNFNPKPRLLEAFESEDCIAVIGTPEQITKVERMSRPTFDAKSNDRPNAHIENT